MFLLLPLSQEETEEQMVGSFLLFFKYKFIYFNWRLITIQYCIDFAIHQHKSAMEKEMATHSSILAWKIPWTDEPGGLQSMGSQRVRDD